MQRFGEKVRLLRGRRRITQRELAKALGYSSQSYINEIEAGKKTPTVEFVLKVSALFDVTTDQLLLDNLDVPETTARAVSSERGE
jgi:transcriptional regulator with XRE-family HTH domain